MSEPQPQYHAPTRPMTRRQEALLAFIRHKRDNGGDSPTYAEIMRAVGITSPSIVSHNLSALERRGLISRPAPLQGHGRWRSIAVTGGRWVYEEATP